MGTIPNISLSEVDRFKKKFKDHILTNVIDLPNFKVFDFRNESGTSNNYQRWIIDKGTLIITKDNYNSIYSWNDRWVSLEFLATCGLDYFNSKCLADKDGSNQKVFESEESQKYLQELALDRFFQNNEEYWDEHEKKWSNYTFNEKIEILGDVIIEQLDDKPNCFTDLFYAENVYEAYEYLSNQDYEFLFGIDGWEYGRNLEVLTAIPKIHLAALRVANEKYPNAW